VQRAKELFHAEHAQCSTPCGCSGKHGCLFATLEHGDTIMGIVAISRRPSYSWSGGSISLVSCSM